MLLRAQSQYISVRHPEWSRDATIYELNVRQFSREGTFKAVIPKLSQIKALGADIIWIMPINPIGVKNRKEPLGSYYSVRNYLEINPEFGNKADFRTLVDSIHSHGMKVIVDWVANHTSWDNVLTKEHPDWYKHDKNGNFVPPVKDWSDVIALDYTKPGLRKYMINAMEYWLTNFNIDGYRCDVAGMVPINFWIQARKALDAIKPVFMLAEAEGPKFHEAFDMTYGWDSYHLFNDIAKGKATADQITTLLNKEKRTYPADSYRMRFTSNHDENSWNGTVFERLGDGAATFAVLACAMDGMPLVYDGQEAGMNKRLKFFEHDPIVWKASPFRNLYTKLFVLKHRNPALRNGDKGGAMEILSNSNPKAVYAFMRQKSGHNVLVILNLSNKEQHATISGASMPGTYHELFTDQQKTFGGSDKVDLKPWAYFVWSN
ncbi:MAG TPA: alpha-amylase family glycosyl hydrolase [Balneolales bacterium]|nr:alpha-amylase family glycosyl hydrolase [Balneolales bacterium]